jgi:hypothetical protein
MIVSAFGVKVVGRLRSSGAKGGGRGDGARKNI